MRNWHHDVIKLDQARNLLPTVDRFGSSDIYVGVIEGEIEFRAINNSAPLTISNYQPAHTSFSDIANSRKVFFRDKDGNQFTQNINSLSPSMHTTCVTGIISGNVDTNSLIDGISPNIRVINSNNFENGLFLALINPFSNGNIKSPFFQSALDTTFINNGASNLSDIYSNRSASIISCSFNIQLTSSKVDFILKELFAYGRDGRGTLVVVSAGNGDSATGAGLEINDTTSSSGFRSTVFSNKSLIVAASKVLLDTNDLASYTNNPVFDERKASYSNYGKRIDLCAPSGPDSDPSKDDISIYSPTMLNCGNVGTDEQSFFAKIISVGSSKLTLENVKGIFKGQSIELGAPNEYFHELRYITRVDKIPNTNNVEVTLDAGIKFTKDFSKEAVSFTLLNKNAKIVVFKKAITRYVEPNGLTSNKKLILEDLKGINPTITTPQKVYIYPKSSPLKGIETEIISIVNLNTNLIEINTDLISLPPYTPVNDLLILVPDQFKASVTCTGPITDNGQNTTYFARSINDVVGFFIGQEILLSGGGKDRIAFISDISGTGIEMSHSPSLRGDTFTISSLAYGNFTSRFTGTSAATPIVSGLAGLVFSANNNLNAAEIKHILKQTADKITGVSHYSLVSNNTRYNYGYTTNDDFGTGRVNAESAVQLAIDWHTSTTVQKPRMEIADRLNGTVLESVLESEIVNSPDMWIKVSSDTSNTEPSETQPFNTIDTSKEQKIYIKVRNSGNRASFKECDLRVFIAFTDELNPGFSFPNNWYDQTNVKLLSVKEIPIIPAGGFTTIAIEWKDIVAKWNGWNNLDATTNKRKNVYLLAHVAPFDGDSNDVRNY